MIQGKICIQQNFNIDLEYSSWIFIIRELCDSKSYGLHHSDNMTTIELKIDQKQKGRQWVHETPILEVIFVTLIENSSVITNDTQEPQKYPYHRKQLWSHTSMSNMALKLSQYFHLLMEKPLGHYFQVRAPYYQVAQCDQKTPIPVSSRWQVKFEKAKKA